MRYWLQRISGGQNGLSFAQPLLREHNILSIGFSEFSTQEFVADVFDRGWSAIDDAMLQLWGETTRRRSVLHRFIYEMKTGDIVIVPGSHTFSIYEIVGERPFSNEELDLSDKCDWNGKKIFLDFDYAGKGKDGIKYLYRDGVKTDCVRSNYDWVDLGFYWNVEPVALDISRADYADALLTMRLKCRQTNLNIDDLEKSITNALQSFENKTPINLYSDVIEETAKTVLKKIMECANPDKFEKIVQNYYSGLSADVIVPAKNSSSYDEGDTDVIAIYDELGLIVRTQVKFHNGETGVEAVRQIVQNCATTTIDRRFNSRFCDDYVISLCVITSAESFSDEARKFASENHVRLITGPEFAKMLLKSGLTALDMK